MNLIYLQTAKLVSWRYQLAWSGGTNLTVYKQKEYPSLARVKTGILKPGELLFICSVGNVRKEAYGSA